MAGIVLLSCDIFVYLSLLETYCLNYFIRLSLKMKLKLDSIYVVSADSF